MFMVQADSGGRREDAEGAAALTVGVFRDARRLLPHAQALGLQVISHLQAKLHTPAHTLSRAQGKVLKSNGMKRIAETEPYILLQLFAAASMGVRFVPIL